MSHQGSIGYSSLLAEALDYHHPRFFVLLLASLAQRRGLHLGAGAEALGIRKADSSMSQIMGKTRMMSISLEMSKMGPIGKKNQNVFVCFSCFFLVFFHVFFLFHFHLFSCSKNGHILPNIRNPNSQISCNFQVDLAFLQAVLSAE